MKNISQKLRKANTVLSNFVKTGGSFRWGLFMPLAIGAGDMNQDVILENGKYDVINSIVISADYSQPEKKDEKISYEFIKQEVILNENKYITERRFN